MTRFRAGVDLLRTGDQLGPVTNVLLIGQSGAKAGAGLDEHAMARPG